MGLTGEEVMHIGVAVASGVDPSVTGRLE